MATAPVLVLIDHTDDGAVRPAVRELLALAARFGSVHGVWVDPVAPGADALAELGAHGASQVHVVAPNGEHHLTPVVAEAIAVVVGSVAPRAVLLTNSFEHKEVAGVLGVRTGAGVVVDAAGLEDSDGTFVATKSVFAATWTTRCAIRTPLAVVAVKPNAAEVVATGQGPASVEVHAVDAEAATAAARGVELVERTERAPSGRPDLSSAQVVVVGGRGTDGDFGPVADLADVLGGAVGATRVATDEGWIDHEAQIGQTGVTVSPRLYIGAGVSGAVHHRGGMQSAGTIIAVNNDPEAPIFEIADLGIVGDLRTVLPAATQELRRLLG
ncbi:electron transfer flavoprotein subunit alpha/FixB family protein [Actinotalea sp.]|uniref:electron transfer flavoprotein subunit alpha/FixB family protein n=1 Tax=Actinotalea sp. TaxID=1872145 RepID=UPI0035658AFC